MSLSGCLGNPPLPTTHTREPQGPKHAPKSTTHMHDGSTRFLLLRLNLASCAVGSTWPTFRYVPTSAPSEACTFLVLLCRTFLSLSLAHPLSRLLDSRKFYTFAVAQDSDRASPETEHKSAVLAGLKRNAMLGTLEGAAHVCCRAGTSTEVLASNRCQRRRACCGRGHHPHLTGRPHHLHRSTHRHCVANCSQTHHSSGSQAPRR